MYYKIYQISWGKAMKCEICLAFYHFFTEFNKFNNTGARISYNIKIILKSPFCVKMLFLPYMCNIVMDVIYIILQIMLTTCVCLFVLILYVHVNIFSQVETGLPGLNQY